MQKTFGKRARALALLAIVAVIPMVSQGRVTAQAAALEGLASFQAIVEDTLALVDKGDLKAARARIKDLETGWDQAEASLRPGNTARWTTIDTAIDEALTSLRRPDPQGADADAALRKLDATLKDAGP